MFKKLIFLLVFLTAPAFLFGAVFYSQGSGDFHTTSLWHLNPGGGAPSGQPNNGNFNNGGDTFVIQAGHTLTSSARLESVKLIVYGSLVIADDRFSVMDSLIIAPGASIEITTTTPIDLGGAFVLNYGDVTAPNGGSFTNYVSTTLPLELIYFTGSWVQGGFTPKVELKWGTYTETDVYEFIITRSDDSKVGRIPGSGTSYTPKFYVFIDEAPLNQGIIQYNLSELTYNNVINLIAKTTVGPNPNPFNSIDTGIELIFEPKSVGPINVALYDLIGRKVYEVKFNSTSIVRFNYSNLKLSNGLYLVEIIQGKTSSFRKLPIR